MLKNLIVVGYTTQFMLASPLTLPYVLTTPRSFCAVERSIRIDANLPQRSLS